MTHPHDKLWSRVPAHQLELPTNAYLAPLAQDLQSYANQPQALPLQVVARVQEAPLGELPHTAPSLSAHHPAQSVAAHL